jgi:hypothetical protein
MMKNFFVECTAFFLFAFKELIDFVKARKGLTSVLAVAVIGGLLALLTRGC